MEKFSIDSKIYAGNLLDELNNLGLAQNLLDSEEINDEESFMEMLIEEIHIAAYKNEIDTGSPMLTEDQLDQVINRCIVQDNLDSLEMDGLVEKNFSPEEMDSIYSITEKGKKLRGDI
jgi:DNA-binding MarR family transcriptional regulator